MQTPQHIALFRLREALALLDEHGPLLSAAYLSQAVESLAAHVAANEALAASTLSARRAGHS